MTDLSNIFYKVLACIYQRPQLANDVDADLFANGAHEQIVKTIQAHLESNPKLTSADAQELIAFDCGEECAMADSEIISYITKHGADISLGHFTAYVNRIKRVRHIEYASRIIGDVLAKMNEPNANPVLMLNEAVEAIKTHGVAMNEETASVSVKQLIESGAYDTFMNSSTNKIPTQFSILNKMLHGGFSVGHLVTIAAKPSSGKTELMVEMAEHIAYKEQRHVLYFTMEMGKCEIVTRLIQSDGSVSYGDLKQGGVSVDSRRGALTAYDTYHVIDGIRDTKRIVNEIRKAKKAGICDICFIDYLGLMKPEEGDAQQRYIELGRMSATLKDLADTLQIPIVIAQQYDRKANGMPTMGNIRESGDIAANSSEVMLIYNPKFDTSADQTTWGDHIALNIDKNREGERGCLILRHNGQCKAIEEEPDYLTRCALVAELDKMSKKE